MSDPVIIRAPRPGDGTGLARCWLDAGNYYTALNPDLFQVPEEDGLAAWLEARLLQANTGDVCYLVAERGEEVVGFILASLQQPLESAARQFVRDTGALRVTISVLVVQEAHRRGGIGTRLLTAVEEWARERGATAVLLETYVESPISLSFYEQRMGYQRRHVEFRKVLQ